MPIVRMIPSIKACISIQSDSLVQFNIKLIVMPTISPTLSPPLAIARSHRATFSFPLRNIISSFCRRTPPTSTERKCENVQQAPCGVFRGSRTPEHTPPKLKTAKSDLLCHPLRRRRSVRAHLARRSLPTQWKLNPQRRRAEARASASA